MAYTQADLDELKRSLVMGTTKVRHADGREVNYRSLAEIQSIINLIQAELDPDPGASARSRRVYTNSRKGL